ncbi:MAG: GHKL domain-containing protein [Bdellovibrionales bacterium]|nr:GHKL domain-containing protein [Bdellovibrionales bacterium]
MTINEKLKIVFYLETMSQMLSQEQDTSIESYIKEQMNIDFVVKSKNSAQAFLLVTVLFLFLQKFQENYRLYIFLLAALVFVLALVRLTNYMMYASGRRTLADAVVGVSVTATLNSALWCAIGIMTILEYPDHNFHLLITFIILISISASSVVTVSHKKIVFIPMNIFVIFPQVFYSYMEYTRENDSNILWLIGYSAINFFYNFRQASVIQNDLEKRFTTEFHLKKSLEQIASSKKNLEEETIKTFHASRLSSLGEMAGGIAHEINNPLTIIQGMTKSVLERSTKLEEPERAKLQKVNLAGERIAKIVRGMKIISSKNDQIEHEITKVSKIIELSLDLFEERIKNEEVEFILKNPSDPSVYCNPLQISQIIINLISNALDALQKYEGKHALCIEVTEDFNRHSVDLRVINNGSLLSKEIVNKIFEPFFTTKSMGKGTGLGLSISQTLAHSNSGTLSYEEYQGQVCFKLQLKTHSK